MIKVQRWLCFDKNLVIHNVIIYHCAYCCLVYKSNFSSILLIIAFNEFLICLNAKPQISLHNLISLGIKGLVDYQYDHNIYIFWSHAASHLHRNNDNKPRLERSLRFSDWVMVMIHENALVKRYDLLNWQFFSVNVDPDKEIDRHINSRKT